MKSIKTRIFIFCIILLAGCGVASADTGKDMEELRLSPEMSAVPLDERESLLKILNDAVKAGVPSTDIALIVKRGLARGWESKSIKESVLLLTKTEQQGLPLTSLLDRFHQGQAKGVPFERVSASANKLTEKLSAADGMVGSLMRGGMKEGKGDEKGKTIQTVARAMERSVPDAAVMQIGAKLMKSNSPLSKLDAAVSTMTNAIEMGMQPAQASKMMNMAIDKGYSETDMMMMEREMFSMMRDGATMNDVMRNMETMMNSGGMGFSGSGMGGGAMIHNGTGMSGSPGMTHGGSGMGGGGGGMHGR
ncbi:MAG: hypothetical protein HZC48_07185 [Nitrospirae bacterium]|nr:hypothetical protein [Nitrospirota bacterium]